MFSKLYARDSDNRIKEWSISISTNFGETSHTVHVEHGLLNGKKVIRKTVINQGKNIGKANETTSLDQAISECESKINKKRRDGYKSLADLEGELVLGKPNHVLSPINTEYSSIENFLKDYLPKVNTNKEDNYSPMKCQNYWKESKGNQVPRITFPCYGQPKINGVRCFAKYKDGKVTLFSKKGLEYMTTPEINEEIRQMIEMSPYNNEEVLIDGELYIHGEILSEIVSAVRIMNLNSSRVKFWMFDIVLVSELEMKQRTRLDILFDIVKDFRATNNQIKTVFVRTQRVNSNSEAQEYFRNYLADGYEGLICRSFSAPYCFGQRPQTIVKLKQRESAEFEIVDIIDTRDNPGIAVFQCRNDLNMELFKVNPEGNLDTKMDYFQNKHKYIGKRATVEFFERTKNGIPFHATLITIRDYE